MFAFFVKCSAVQLVIARRVSCKPALHQETVVFVVINCTQVYEDFKNEVNCCYICGLTLIIIYAVLEKPNGSFTPYFPVDNENVSGQAFLSNLHGDTVVFL